MKKHYITPTIKSVTFAFNQSLLADSIQANIDGGDTDIQGTRSHRGSWGNLWDVGEE